MHFQHRYTPLWSLCGHAESSALFLPSGSTVSRLALLKVLLVLMSMLMVVKQK